MRALRRLVPVVVAASMVATGCIGGGGSHTYHAIFSRAVQIFEAGRVRVLGVNVGTITDIKNTANGVDVTFTVSDGTKLPAGVGAAVVPASLLGERFIQLVPAYTSGPTLQPGATIPEARTAVPAEPDELLRSLQNYLGALDPHTVTKFVENAAAVLQGNGQELNLLIHHGADVLSELAVKRADLAQIIVQFDKVSSALATRQAALGNLIHAYNSVAGTLITNRAALEGTVTGLRDASLQLADLLLAHQVPLHGDVANLTRTGQTLSKNIHHLVNTGGWASRLFHAAERAVDYNKRWLRLNNQGAPLAGLIMMRLQQRLQQLCSDLGLPFCAVPSFWAQHVPSMFCFKSLAQCKASPATATTPLQQLTNAIDQIPALLNALLTRAEHITCVAARYPSRCLQRKALLIQCAKAKDLRGCLEKHAVLLTCLKAKNVTDVKKCIAAHQKDDVKKLVNGLLKHTIGNPNLVNQFTGGGA